MKIVALVVASLILGGCAHMFDHHGHGHHKGEVKHHQYDK